jgi:hypothetical protein
MPDETINLEEWYTADQAAARLSQNSGKTIGAAYPRMLAYHEKVKTHHLDKRTVLYWKADIDAYRVEGRGRRPKQEKGG